ncbi:hypothetical protein, partial [Acinetobacter baumannii]|uniref:hypothetical protein n=1 Tax=Acinetobacter baumannii TaxID=470 RepID=UPI001BC88239
GGIRHLEISLNNGVDFDLVHGCIRHLDIRTLHLNVRRKVHDVLKQLENCDVEISNTKAVHGGKRHLER